MTGKDQKDVYMQNANFAFDFPSQNAESYIFNSLLNILEYKGSVSVKVKVKREIFCYPFWMKWEWMEILHYLEYLKEGYDMDLWTCERNLPLISKKNPHICEICQNELFQAPPATLNGLFFCFFSKRNLFLEMYLKKNTHVLKWHTKRELKSDTFILKPL